MAANQRPTKAGTPKLSEVARHVVSPAGITSTGWPSVRDKCGELGVSFDSWQDGAGRLILAKRADGQYAASIGGVVISIPRQVGKTFLILAIIFALCLLHPGLTVLWTSHHERTTGETFGKVQGFAARRKVAPHVQQVLIDAMTVKFKNGSRIMFGARERGFGRGFDNVDIEVFDEAQILTDKALDDMIPAMNTAANPLPLFMGTPPKPTDPAEVFTRKRAEALAGDDEDTAYIELSADRGCNPLDRKQWAKANASYPHRTPESAMLRMKKQLTPESFLREGLGIWDDEAHTGAIPNWADLRYVDGETVGIGSSLAWALAVSPIELGPQWASIGKAGVTAGGFLHVEWVEHRKGTRWIVPTCKQHYDANGNVPLRVRRNGPEGAFIPDLLAAGVQVVEVSGVEEAQATGAFIAASSAEEQPPTLRHLGQPSLDKAVGFAALRTGPDGAAKWESRKASIEITPLVAVTIALGGVPQQAGVYAGGFTALADIDSDDDWED